MEQRLVELAQELARSLPPGDLDQTLSRITAAAVRVLPDVTMSSITIKHADGRLETVAPTDDLLCEVDAKQYELQEGPCYEAATDTPHVVSNDLAADSRWPAYTRAALDSGIRSQVGVRLFDAKRSQGALNLYSDRVGAFEDLGSLADLFREQSAMALAYAHEIQNLREAVQTRQLIGQAVGVLMERYSLSDQRAFAFLARLSSTRNVKLRVVAQEVIAELSGDNS
jgi:GAF domain-containing protein